MSRWHIAGWVLILMITQVFAFGGTCSAALPLPPDLNDTTWEGRYELANNVDYRYGTMVLNITSDSGALFRGKIVLDGGRYVELINGAMVDGEILITLFEGTIKARLVYDRVTSSSTWKMTGVWQDTGYHDPDRPKTIWFILKKR